MSFYGSRIQTELVTIFRGSNCWTHQIITLLFCPLLSGVIQPSGKKPLGGMCHANSVCVCVCLWVWCSCGMLIEIDTRRAVIH